MATPTPRRLNGRSVLLTTVVLACGFTIAWIDTRPKWDDTGITAGALLVAATIGGVLGMRPWLAALFVVAPLLVAELHSAGPALLVPAGVASLGAHAGAFVRNARSTGVMARRG